jgi:hypothetical protein
MTAEQIVNRQLEYYNSHDLEGFASTYSKTIRIYNQGETTPYIEGIEALRKRYAERFSVPGLHAEIANRMVMGSFVIDYENITAEDENKAAKAIAIYEVRDGLIQNVWFIRE